MHEHRLTRRLLNYWHLIRKNKDYPDIMRFNAGAIEDVWPYCFKISITQNKSSLLYTYEYMGEPIIDIYGQDLTGMTVNHHMQNFPGSVIHKKLQEAIKEYSPLLDDGHFVSRHGKLIKYRACLLPFGTPKRGVTHIVVGLSCRVF